MDFPDISHNMQMIQQSFQEVAWEKTRPSIIMKPQIFIYEEKWFCKYGEIEGIGETPSDAMQAFDKEMTKYIKPHFYLCKCGEEIEVTYKTSMEYYPCSKCKRTGQWIKQPF